MKAVIPLCAGLLAAMPVAGRDHAAAQPAPSFTATCGELRDKIAEHGLSEDDYVTIEVAGELTLVEEDGVLAYMGVCSAPDPLVLCITYSANDYRAGDRVILAGTYARPSADAVRLDPCLHYPPEGAGDGG